MQTTFRLVKHAYLKDVEIVEVWCGPNLIGAIYPIHDAERGVRFFSRYKTSVMYGEGLVVIEVGHGMANLTGTNYPGSEASDILREQVVLLRDEAMENQNHELAVTLDHVLAQMPLPTKGNK